MKALFESILSKKEVQIAKNINVARLNNFYTELFKYMKNYDLTYYDRFRPNRDTDNKIESIYKTKIHGEPNYTSSKAKDMYKSIDEIIKKHKFKFKKEMNSNKLKSTGTGLYKSLNTYNFVLETDEYGYQEVCLYVYMYDEYAEVFWHVTIPEDYEELLKII